VLLAANITAMAQTVDLKRPRHQSVVRAHTASRRWTALRARRSPFSIQSGALPRPWPCY